MARFTRRGTIRIVSFSLAVAVVFAGVAVYQMNIARTYQRQLDYSYQRAFSETVEYVANIQSSLSKSQYASTPSQIVTLSSDIWRQSGAAKASLSQLPLSEANLDILSRFLSQVGDYVYSLSKKVTAGQNITDEDYKSLAKFNEYATKLSDSLVDMQQDVTSGTMTLYDSGSGAKKAVASSKELPRLSDSLVKVQDSFSDYPQLIYDGPFSDHIEKQTSQVLNGLPEITAEQAKAKAAAFLKADPAKLQSAGDGSGTIGEYSFTFGSTYIEVTKAGGYILTMQDSRTVGTDRKLTPEEGAVKAAAYLDQIGYKDMIKTYYVVANNIVTVNFCYVQDGIVCYPDLVKVGIALDNGSTVMLDTNGYLMTHQSKRSLQSPQLTKDKAAAVVSSRLTIGNIRLCIIPSDGLYERFCYEFKCTNSEGQYYLVYINAITGVEEKILILLDTPGGTLTI